MEYFIWSPQYSNLNEFLNSDPVFGSKDGCNVGGLASRIGDHLARS